MPSITIFEFFLLSLASFRITRLIVFDTITTFLRKPFHEIVEEENEDGVVEKYLHIKGSGIKFWIGELLSCYWCVGVWISIILYSFLQVFPAFVGSIIIIFAIAAMASIVETVVSKLIG